MTYNIVFKTRSSRGSSNNLTLLVSKDSQKPALLLLQENESADIAELTPGALLAIGNAICRYENTLDSGEEMSFSEKIQLPDGLLKLVYHNHGDPYEEGLLFTLSADRGIECFVAARENDRLIKALSDATSPQSTGA